VAIRAQRRPAPPDAGRRRLFDAPPFEQLVDRAEQRSAAEQRPATEPRSAAEHGPAVGQRSSVVDRPLGSPTAGDDVTGDGDTER